MNLKIKLNNKILNIQNIHICSPIEKLIGLMFKNKEKAYPLLFKFSKPTKMPIHSFFVRFPFLAIWFDDKNKIIDYKLVFPNSLKITPKQNFSSLIEIPLNEKHNRIIEFLVEQRKV